MGFLFLIAFIGIPLIETAVFIKVGGIVGLWPTLIIVIATAVIGTTVLRRQGLATLSRARQQMDQGSLPLAEIFDGICLLIAGAFLLTPGFITDGLGALLLVPAFRLILRKFVGSRVKVADMPSGAQGPHHNPNRYPPGHAPPGFTPSGLSGQGDVIDGDYADITEKPADSTAIPKNKTDRE